MMVSPGWIKRNSALSLIIVGFLTVVGVPYTNDSFIHAVPSWSAVNIWVDKGCGGYYNDGEWIDIYFRVYADVETAAVTITHYSPQGSSFLWYESGRVVTNKDLRISREADCPDGLHRLVITAVVTVEGEQETVTSECVYFVRACKTIDYDRDGYISVLSGGDDCDDFDENVHPGAAEVCDGKDNDCNRLIDEGLDCTFVSIWVDKQCGGHYNDRENVHVYFIVYADAEKATVSVSVYSTAGVLTVLMKDKPVNTYEEYHLVETAACPEGVERLVITAVVPVDGKTKTVSAECIVYVANCKAPDSDNDGYIAVVAGGNDCNDDDPGVYPGAAEVCDGKDNNCNRQKDEGFDADQDGYTTCGGDCDDGDPNVNPRAVEVCDGKDNNCNGFTDEGFTDNDQDGYAECNDCDDANAEINPGVTEVQDGIDNDCDGEIDEVASIDQIDEDQDGFPLSVDCNDQNRSIHPVATELCNDGIDNDCDRRIDCDDTDCEGNTACEKGLQLPFDLPFDIPDLDGIVSLIRENILYVAAGAAGLVAVIMMVLLLKLTRRKRGPPVTELPSVTGIPSRESSPARKERESVEPPVFATEPTREPVAESFTTEPTREPVEPPKKPLSEVFGEEEIPEPDIGELDIFEGIEESEVITDHSDEPLDIEKDLF